LIDLLQEKQSDIANWHLLAGLKIAACRDQRQKLPFNNPPVGQQICTSNHLDVYGTKTQSLEQQARVHTSFLSERIG